MSKDPFDGLLMQPDFDTQKKAQHERRDYLYHKVFLQNPDGAELLKIWDESLKMTPADHQGADLFNLGKSEGLKDFFRKIILTIKRVDIDE